MGKHLRAKKKGHDYPYWGHDYPYWAHHLPNGRHRKFKN